MIYASLPVPLETLETYPLFRRHDPVVPIDLNDHRICGGPNRLHYAQNGGAVREMIEQADRTCYQYTGQKPPSQVGLFLAQFPDGTYDDATFALAALHLHKEIGAGCCCAAAWIEPLEYDDEVGAQIQEWAVYHLTLHPWSTAREWAERLARSAKVKWVSHRAQHELHDYIRRNHDHAEEFLAQHKAVHHPLHR